MLNFTVYLSTTSVLTMLGYCAILMPGGGGFACKSIEYFTSSAVTSLPSWNLTPLRRCQTHVFWSGFSHVSANAGCTFRSLSHSTSESYMNSLPHWFEVLIAPKGIKFTGSFSMAQVIFPPDLGLSTAGADVAAGPAGVLPAGAGEAGAPHAASTTLATAAPPTATAPFRNSRRDTTGSLLTWPVPR